MGQLLLLTIMGYLRKRKGLNNIESLLKVRRSWLDSVLWHACTTGKEGYQKKAI